MRKGNLQFLDHFMDLSTLSDGSRLVDRKIKKRRKTGVAREEGFRSDTNMLGRDYLEGTVFSQN